MKKFLLLAICAIAFSSCYSTRIMVGVNENTPVKEVKSVTNHHLVYGLLQYKDTDLNPKDYVGGRSSYMVKKHQTIINAILSGVTFGIYTPTTTTFYVPMK